MNRPNIALAAASGEGETRGVELHAISRLTRCCSILHARPLKSQLHFFFCLVGTKKVGTGLEHDMLDKTEVNQRADL